MAARCAAWNAITAHSIGVAHSTRKPRQNTSGRKAAAGPAPKRWISRPVAKHCTRRVSIPIARSMKAKMRVRTAGSSDAAATMLACWK
ncbi:hypothetical protein D3C83_77760 [compost metagenome]